MTKTYCRIELILACQRVDPLRVDQLFLPFVFPLLSLFSSIMILSLPLAAVAFCMVAVTAGPLGGGAPDGQPRASIRSWDWKVLAQGSGQKGDADADGRR